MKKLILTVTLTMAVVTASFHAQVKEWIIPEETTTKNVLLHVSAGDVYHAKVYDASAAQLHLTVIKIKGKQIRVIMENDYPELKLNQFPDLSQSFNQKIQIADVTDSKEQIVINYVVTYTTKGSVLKIENNKFLAKGNINDELKISI